MRRSEIGGGLAAFLTVTIMPLPAIAPASAVSAKVITPVRVAAINPADANRALLAIAARDERCKGKDPYLMPVGIEACSSRTMDAAEALVQRAGTRKRFAALMRDLFEPMVWAMSEGDPGEAHDVTALGIEADLAQKRAAILTGATAAERAIERSETEDMGNPPPVRKRPKKGRGLFDWVDKDRHFMESPGANIHSRALALRWQTIRDADCAAYPVPHCAVRLDAAMRNMFEDLND